MPAPLPRLPAVLLTLGLALPQPVLPQAASTGTGSAPPTQHDPKPPGTAQPGNAETPAVVVDATSADTVLGKPVQSAAGEDMGRIVDVMIDRNGTVRAAIVDFGGFLGVGSRKIAVDWRVLHFPPDGSMAKLIADLPKAQVQAAPVFKAGEPVVIIGRADAASAAPPAAPAPAPPPQPTPPATSTPLATAPAAPTSPATPPAAPAPPAPAAAAPAPVAPPAPPQTDGAKRP